MEKSDIALILVIVSILVFGGMDYWQYQEIKLLKSGGSLDSSGSGDRGPTIGNLPKAPTFEEIKNQPIPFTATVGKFVSLDENSRTIKLSNPESGAETSYNYESDTVFMGMSENSIEPKSISELNFKPGDFVEIGKKAGETKVFSITKQGWSQ